MNNAAFRQLLEEKRSEVKKPAVAQGSSQLSTQPGGKKRSQGSKKYQQLLEQKQKAKEREEESGKYTDRAAARRNNASGEGADGGLGAIVGGVDIEMSKYLGGDVAHTHLVKGLDFALLSKVRDEMKKNDVAGQGRADSKLDAPGRAGRMKTAKFSEGFRRGGASSGGAAAGTTLSLGQAAAATDVVVTRTHMGRAIAFFLSGAAVQGSSSEAAGVAVWRRKTASQELFERLGFEFALHADKFDPSAELPVSVSRAKVTLNRSAGDDDDADDVMFAGVGDQLAARVCGAFEAHRAGRKHKRVVKAPSGFGVGLLSSSSVSTTTASAPGRAAGPNDDEDIFSGVGQYQPAGDEDGGGEEARAAAPARKRSRWDAPAAGDYFSNLRAANDEDEEESEVEAAERAKRAVLAGIRGMAQAADRMEARRTGAGVVADAAGASGANADVGLAGRGHDYGETYDYDFAGEDN